MKKTVCMLLAVMLCASAFGMLCVSGAETASATTIDSDLLLHWDFEGTDLETQLANKAAAGSATDSISFNTDGISSKIENGECTVGDETTEWLSFIVDTDNGKGNTLVDKVTDSYTIYVRFKMDKNPTETTTVMALNHKNGKAIKQRLWMGATGSLSLRPNNVRSNQFSVSDSMVIVEEYCAVAVTLKKNEDKTFTVTLYQTYDDWGELTMSASKENLTGAESTPVMANGFDMLFAGGMWNQITGGNQADIFKPGSSYTYDDIRFYGRALSEDEIKTINVDAGNSDNGGAGDSANTGADNNSGTNTPADGNNTNNASTPETKAPETTAPDVTEAKKDGETAAEEKSGCGSAIGFAVIPVALAAGGACLIKRKKK